MLGARGVVAAAMVVAVGLWVSGCYTTLKHPVLRRSLVEEEQVRVTHGDNCWECHSSRTEWFWTDETPPPAAGYYAWDYYYSSSWWLEQPYVVQVPSPEEEGLTTPRGFRRGNQTLSTPGAPAMQQPSPTLQGVARRVPAAAEPAAAEVKPADDERRDTGRRESGSTNTSKEKRRERKP